MAEILKRQYELVVFKVTLDTSTESPHIRFELEVKRGGEPATVAAWDCSAADMRLPDRIERRQTLYRGYEFTVPPHVIAGLKASLDRETTPDTPLWLHLVKPHGYLGMVPWERLLQPELHVPMLRLPDFVVQPPRETPAALDVLLCSSAPMAKDRFRIADYLVILIQRLQNAVSRRTRFHVFADAADHDEIKKALEKAGFPESTAVLYDPATAAPLAVPERNSNIPDQTSRIENPWLLWMRDALQGRSVDVAHFICHGYLSGERGALSLAESPLSNTDTRMARFVGAAELRAFLTQVGAWSAVFSSPAGNYSEMGLRQLADSIAQARPGPLVHHEFPLDPKAEALAGAYRLVYDRKPQPPPASPALFIYCQPFRVRIGAEDDTQSFAAAPPPAQPSPDLDSIYQTSENVPAWVAASERYVEQCELRVQKMRPQRPNQESAKAAAAHDRTAASLESTLRDIRAVIGRVAATTQSGEHK
jgi:hypothetical protein